MVRKGIRDSLELRVRKETREIKVMEEFRVHWDFRDK
jgi:hypothetical protein